MPDLLADSNECGELFAGMGGFGLALERAGMRCAWQVEIEPHAQMVLRRHFPLAKLLADVRKAGRRNLRRVKVITGGFPCQDFSVAGLRKGWNGVRSVLFFEMLRVIDELQPTYVLWENVPGLLSSCSCRRCRRHCERCGAIAGAEEEACGVCGSDDLRGRVLRGHHGADLFAVISALGFIGFDGAWTLLDSQWFGVPQRRQRLFGVFARRDIGAGRCAEILSFGARLQGNITPIKKARQGIAAPVKSGTPSRRNGGSSPTAEEFVIGTLAASGAGLDRPAGQGNELDFCIPIAFDQAQITSKSNRSRAQAGAPAGTLNTKGVMSVAGTLNAHSERGLQGRDADSGLLIAHALTAAGHDASEDGSGRGTPIVAQALTAHHGRQNPDSQQFVGFTPRRTHSDAIENISPTMNTGGGGMGAPGVQGAFGVRRLTPVECVRLQGFPDDWAAWGLDAKGQRVEMSDSAQYRMAGNAVTVNTVEWIARRLVAA